MTYTYKNTAKGASYRVYTESGKPLLIKAGETVTLDERLKSVSGHIQDLNPKPVVKPKKEKKKTRTKKAKKAVKVEEVPEVTIDETEDSKTTD